MMKYCTRSARFAENTDTAPITASVADPTTRMSHPAAAGSALTSASEKPAT